MLLDKEPYVEYQQGVNTDPNTLFTEGRWAIGSTTPNLPTGAFGVGTLLVFDCLVYVVQIYVDLYGKVFSRLSTDKSTWQSWYNVNDHYFQTRLYINGVYTTLKNCDLYLFGNQAYVQAIDYPGQEGTPVTIANFTLN